MEATLSANSNPFDSLVKFVDQLGKPGAGEWRKVADAATQGMAESFTREGSASGRWRPLAPLTVRLRQAKGLGGSHPILVQSGRLRASWTQRGAPGHVERFSPDGSGWELVVGASSDLASWHESGTRRMPARPVLPISDAAEERLLATLDYLVAQIEARTLGR